MKYNSLIQLEFSFSNPPEIKGFLACYIFIILSNTKQEVSQ